MFEPTKRNLLTTLMVAIIVPMVFVFGFTALGGDWLIRDTGHESYVGTRASEWFLMGARWTVFLPIAVFNRIDWLALLEPYWLRIYVYIVAQVGYWYVFTALGVWWWKRRRLDG